MQKAEEIEESMEIPRPKEQEIKPGTCCTCIYSNGSEFVDDNIGSCVSSLNTGGKH